MPTALPAVVGANFVVNVVLWLAARFNGVVSPAMLNPVPVALTAEMVTLALPEFVKVIVC